MSPASQDAPIVMLHSPVASQAWHSLQGSVSPVRATHEPSSQVRHALQQSSGTTHSAPIGEQSPAVVSVSDGPVVVVDVVVDVVALEVVDASDVADIDPLEPLLVAGTGGRPSVSSAVSTGTHLFERFPENSP